MFKKIISSLLLIFLVACSNNVAFNGEIVSDTRATLIINTDNMYEYVGAMDYVFVGKVIKADNVIKNKVKEYGDDFSTYKIEVIENLKGNLIKEIEVNKHGGLKKDGTMYLLTVENPDGTKKLDNGIPELDNTYIFMGYGQYDGSILLSEIFDNRIYDDSLKEEYKDYIDNQIEFERERLKSKYEQD